MTPNGILPMAERVDPIVRFPEPKRKDELQRFLGMMNYYNRFIPQAAQVLIPLHDAVGNKMKDKKAVIQWTPECQSAFSKAKELLAAATLLQHPSPSAETRVTTDASGLALGGKLEQKVKDRWCPVAFFSKKLKTAEQKYSAFDRELLAIYLAIKHWRHFLEGRTFHVLTDQRPLTFALDSTTERSPRQTTHLSFIAEFTSDIRYVKGVENTVADTLSRVEAISVALDYAKLAQDQALAPDIQELRHADTALVLQDEKFGEDVCDVATGSRRPLIPPNWRKRVFEMVHNLSHAGPRPTIKAIAPVSYTHLTLPTIYSV